MPSKLAQIKQAKQLVIRLYLAKCQKIRPQIVEFQKSSQQSPFYFKADSNTARRDLSRSLNSSHFNEHQARKVLDAVSARLYQESYPKADQFLYVAFKIARQACHNKFKQQMYSMGLHNLDKRSAIKTTSLGTFLIDLTTTRNLYQIIKFLDLETALAQRYQKGQSKQFHNIKIGHDFIKTIAAEPSLSRLYQKTLKEYLHKTGITLAKAKQLPGIIQYLSNMAITMKMCEYITHGKHNQDLFNMSAEECLHLPKSN